VRLVFCNGSLFTEGPLHDYEWGPDGELICHNKALWPVEKIRVLEFGDAVELVPVIRFERRDTQPFIADESTLPSDEDTDPLRKPNMKRKK